MNTVIPHNRVENCGKSSDSRCADMHYCFDGLQIGKKPHPIMIVLDSPFASMANTKQIFSGDVGKYLYYCLTESGLNPEDCFITFAVRCINPNQKIKSQDTKKSRHFLIEEINRIKPKYVIAMGSNAACCLVGKAQNLKSLRQRILHIDGIDAPIGVTFSPGAIFAEPHFKVTICRDFKWIAKNVFYVNEETLDYRVNEYQAIVPDIVSFDLETDGLNAFDPSKEILTAAYSDRPGRAIGFRLNHPDGFDRAERNRNILQINKLLSNPKTIYVGQNIKFDLVWWLQKYGHFIAGKLFDTKVAYSLLDENAPDNTLKFFAAEFTTLGHYDDSIDVKNLRQTDFERVIKYNCMDADAARRIYDLFNDSLSSAGLLPLNDFMMSVLPVLAEMESLGVYIDQEWANDIGSQVKTEFENARTKIFEMVGEFNLNHAGSLAHYMYLSLRLPVISATPKGQPGTDRTTINHLLEIKTLTEQQRTFLILLKKYRECFKLFNTYFVRLPEYLQFDGRLHTNYNMTKSKWDKGETGTVTGRLSSSNPNLQNIPARADVRGMFSASPGWTWCDGDYSQLEIRVAAYYGQEPALMSAFEQGLDIHTSVMTEMLNRDYEEIKGILKDETHREHAEMKKQRVAIKRLNFGILYGVGPETLVQLCRAMGVIISKQEAHDMIEKWLSKYPKINRWIYKTKQQAVKSGVVRSPTGRTRHVYGANFSTPVGLGLLRQAVNFPIQTLASEICLAALILIDGYFEKFKIPARLLLTVHDSIAFECHQSVDAQEIVNNVKALMTKGVVRYFKNQFGFSFNVPLEVDFNIGERWIL